jgi:hypothetical protein
MKAEARRQMAEGVKAFIVLCSCGTGETPVHERGQARTPTLQLRGLST